MWCAILFLTIVEVFVYGCCQESRLTITPSSPTLTFNQSDTTGIAVTVSCQPPSSVSGNIYNMIINRSPHSSTAGFVAVASIASGGVATTTLTGATVSADISVGGSRTLTLTLPQAKCADSGQYECQTTVAGPGGVGADQYSSTSNLTLEVSPGLIVLTPTPSGISNWVVNNTLTMLCDGIVGTADDPSRIEWNWDYQVTTSQGFPGTWRNYDGSVSDIVTGNLVNAGPCYKRQSSTLSRNLQVEDTGRIYRCWVRNHDMNGDYSNFAQEVAVGTVTATVESPPIAGQGGKGRGGADTVTVALAVVLSVVVIALIVTTALVVWLCRRLRQANTGTPEPGNIKDRTVSLVGLHQGMGEREAAGPYDIGSHGNPAVPYDSLDMRDVGVRSEYSDIGSHGNSAGPYDSPHLPDVGVGSEYTDVRSQGNSAGPNSTAGVESPYEIPG